MLQLTPINLSIINGEQGNSMTLIATRIITKDFS